MEKKKLVYRNPQLITSAGTVSAACITTGSGASGTYVGGDATCMEGIGVGSGESYNAAELVAALEASFDPVCFSGSGNNGRYGCATTAGGGNCNSGFAFNSADGCLSGSGAS